jgi:sarcosine oxidase delta subunit
MTLTCPYCGREVSRMIFSALGQLARGEKKTRPKAHYERMAKIRWWKTRKAKK